MIKKFLIVALFSILVIVLLNRVMGILDTDSGINPIGHSNKQAYISSDVTNENILVLLKVKEEEKKSVWSQSFLKDEMLKEFPKFQNMKELVENRVIDNGQFKKELLKKIEINETKFIAGDASRADIFMNLTYL